jgi:protocatechuate 3,4-dioxygenase beta subunit
MRCRTLLAAFCFALSAIGQQPALLGGTGVVEGRVVDMRGDGVPAARVRIATYDDPTKALAQAVADGEGYFRVAKVPEQRSLRVHADADGFCTGAQNLGSARGVQVAMQHAVVVRGTLKNRKGEPVPDTMVRATTHCRSLVQVRCDARTDGDGRYELAAVPLAPMEFTAWVAGEGLAREVVHVSSPRELDLQPNVPSSTNLTVEIRGLPAGAPAVDLQLWPYVGGRAANFPPPIDRQRLDANGRWQLNGAPDWEYIVTPSSKTFAFEPDEIRVKAGKGPHSLTFTATPLGATSLVCRAVVRDASGKPMAGLPFRMRDPASATFAAATSDADGRLEFASPLAKGAEALIYTTDEAWVIDQQRNLDRIGGLQLRDAHIFRFDPAEEVSLRVIPACSVHGRVVLADGRPAAFVTIELQERDTNRNPQWMWWSKTTSDREGNFRFVGCPHHAHPVRLHVNGKAGSFAGEPFPLLQPGAKHAAGDLQLHPPSTIEGVLRSRDRAVPGICIRVFHRQSGSVFETLTDREGRFRLLGVAPGPVYLHQFDGSRVQHPVELAVEPFEVESGKAYTFDLDRWEK